MKPSPLFVPCLPSADAHLPCVHWGARRPPYGPPEKREDREAEVLLPSGGVVNVLSASFPQACLYLHGLGVGQRRVCLHG